MGFHTIGLCLRPVTFRGIGPVITWYRAHAGSGLVDLSLVKFLLGLVSDLASAIEPGIEACASSIKGTVLEV